MRIVKKQTLLINTLILSGFLMITSITFMFESDSLDLPTVFICLLLTATTSTLLTILFYSKKIKVHYENSLTDPVTGLYNYKEFTKRINQEKARSKRIQIPFSLLLIDIDNFKDFNNKYGYKKADKMMLQLIAVLKSELRRTDTLFRYRSGDEFTIIAVNTDTKGVLKFAERIKQRVNSNKFNLDNETLELKVSIGVSTFDDKHTFMEDKAELALLEDKKKKLN